MIVAFNDISTRYLYDDKYKAIEEIQRGLETLKYLRKLNPLFKLYAESTIRYEQLAPGYYFNQIFHEKDEVFSRNNKTFLRTILKNYNKIKWEKNVFRFRNEESVQCAWAYRNGHAVFSFSSQKEFLYEQIKGIYTTEDGAEQPAAIENIADIRHIDIHKDLLGIRKYESNPKHKINYGWGSDMDLSDEEAQKVLNTAIAAGDEKKHLIAKYKGRYYSFRCHYDNCYHGYIDDTMPENLKNKADRGDE